MSRHRWLIIVLFVLLAANALPVVRAQSCDLTTQEAFVERGDERRNAGNHEAAIQDYTCALEINGRNVLALFGRAYSYDAIGQYTQAERDYNAVLERNSQDTSAYNNRGNIYYGRGEYDRALSDYNRAIELPNEERQIPYLNRGNLYYEMGNYTRAIADLTAALELSPDYADAYISRAGAYDATGENARALADIARWIDLTVRSSASRDSSAAAAGDAVTLSQGMVFRYVFEAEAGQRIRASARSTGEPVADALLLLQDAQGRPLAWDDDSGINLDAVLRYDVETSASYTLLVTHAAGGSTGPLLVTIETAVPDAADSLSAAPNDAFLAYNLRVNNQALVFTSGGDRLNLRSGPGLDFEILDRLQRDTVVTLLEGPRKNDSYNWWRIRTESGAEGWAVERVEEEQTLLPTLTVGGDALVTVGPDDSLRVRESPGRSATVVARLPANVVVQILDGPRRADGFAWWKIRTPEGQEGWAVERVEGERTLTPLSP